MRDAVVSSPGRNSILVRDYMAYDRVMHTAPVDQSTRKCDEITRTILNRIYRAQRFSCFGFYFIPFYTALAAAQYNVIGPVYLFVAGCVCVCVCVCVFVCLCVGGGSVTTITRNCVHRSSPNWVFR